ncbi:putative endonuclease [Gillisia sp. Hel_I_86]|uniref:GIY-YIG nuclease family protein n=1 Tax=Gillisia sp. Hel_I_86 TaxID=1249981 RepID=UPI00119A9E71|nr:GIY-YIG nuclease family protein [Gillisia sp. Hel_I_86]TVZ26792.1 putative endonuclease [Gillisia sp. Hel_I_86]
MHYLYIIYSEKLKKYYVGETSDIDQRLQQHNSHYFKNNYTKGAEDWVVKLKFRTSSKDEAILLERYIKRMKSRKFTEKLIALPAILEDILKNK